MHVSKNYIFIYFFHFGWGSLALILVSSVSGFKDLSKKKKIVTNPNSLVVINVLCTWFVPPFGAYFIKSYVSGRKKGMSLLATKMNQSPLSLDIGVTARMSINLIYHAVISIYLKDHLTFQLCTHEAGYQLYMEAP